MLTNRRYFLLLSEQGPEWELARLTVTPVDTEGGGHIMIMAAAGGGANGNIAVDDVTLKFGECGESSGFGKSDQFFLWFIVVFKLFAVTQLLNGW